MTAKGLGTPADAACSLATRTDRTFDMRAAILMCLFVLCAALSMHYAIVVKRLPERSDPIVSLDAPYRLTSIHESSRSTPDDEMSAALLDD